MGANRSLFPDLPALEADEAALHALGRPGGPCDLGIDCPDDGDAHVWEASLGTYVIVKGLKASSPILAGSRI